MKNFLSLFIFAMVVVSAAETKPDPKPEEKPAVAPSATPYKTAEMAEFVKLTKETLAALAAGKQTEMVAKLTDLETAWDDKEKVFRPRNEAVWVSIDKTMDKAISALRSSKVNLTKGKAHLEALLKEINAACKD